MRVFIVEDSRVVREHLVAMLSDLQGIEIIGYADHATDATESIRILRPDAVVLDMQIHGGSGIGVLRAIRRLQPPPIVVIFTNDPIPQSRQRYLDAGADFYLDKASEFERLIEIFTSMTHRPLESRQGEI